MESKLLQLIINENNLNKKIEELKKENDFFRNIIENITTTNNNEIKNDKIISYSFANDKNEESYYRYDKNDINNNLNHYRNNNVLKINKKNNSYNNSICSTNSRKNKINKIKIKPIIIKSKCPSNCNSLSFFKLQEFKSIYNNMTRNNSEKDGKLKNNINKTNYQINNNIRKQINEEIKYKGCLITNLDKNENININNNINKRIGFVKNYKNFNSIKTSETEYDLIKENNFKKIKMANRNKLLKEDNISFSNIKGNNNNSIKNSFLSNSNHSCIINISKQKNELNINKIINSFNTIDNYTSQDKSKNNNNYYKLVNNMKNVHTFININKLNIKIKKGYNKNMTNNKIKQIIIKKGKNNQRKIKAIINISSSADINKK